jgi:hypothetical protein
MNNLLSVKKLFINLVAVINSHIIKDPLILGRWHHNLNKHQLDTKISLANSDNCYHCVISNNKK